MYQSVFLCVLSLSCLDICDLACCAVLCCCPEHHTGAPRAGQQVTCQLIPLSCCYLVVLCRFLVSPSCTSLSTGTASSACRRQPSEAHHGPEGHSLGCRYCTYISHDRRTQPIIHAAASSTPLAPWRQPHTVLPWRCPPAAVDWTHLPCSVSQNFDAAVWARPRRCRRMQHCVLTQRHPLWRDVLSAKPLAPALPLPRTDNSWCCWHRVAAQQLSCS